MNVLIKALRLMAADSGVTLTPVMEAEMMAELVCNASSSDLMGACHFLALLSDDDFETFVIGEREEMNALMGDGAFGAAADRVLEEMFMMVGNVD